MDLRVETQREHYISKVVTESVSAQQHAAAVNYCNQYKCKASRGIRLAREADPGCWPEVTLNSLRGALKKQASTEFPEETAVPAVDQREVLTTIERSDLAAGMYAAA